MCWKAKYAILLLFSTVVTYLSGLLIYKTPKTNLKKCVVALSFILNLGILFFFKYCNFAIALFCSALSFVNINITVPSFDILLPVGISFYTFQYALFVSFFPQLVAGPIERSKNLLAQLSVPNKFSYDRFREGLLLMLWGYFLKIVLADRIAIFVDRAYSDPYTYNGYYLIVATILFADICKKRGFILRNKILLQDGWFRCLFIAAYSAPTVS